MSNIFLNILLRSSKRESNYELLRLFAQFLIVLYHICYIWQGELAHSAFFRSICIFLHTGVVIFILLSGYFTIKASTKGLVKFLGIFIVYDLIEVAFNIADSKTIFDILKELLLISNTHYWFIKTYLFLYLISPFINRWLHTATQRERWYMLFVFSFIACYIATMGGDPTLKDGKNLVNFIFIYLVGYEISQFESRLYSISIYKLVVMLFALNSLLISSSFFFYDTIIGKLLLRLSFPYCSPFLLVNSVLIIIIFGRFKFKAPIINYMAESALAVYLIHGSRPIMPNIHTAVACAAQNITNSNILLLFLYAAYSLIVVFSCIFIDKLLTPLWLAINHLGRNLSGITSK